MKKNLPFIAVRLVVQIVLAMIELGFWALHVLGRFVIASLDAARNRHVLVTGRVFCPRGHEIPTDGGVYRCTACDFTYEGSIWQCANPECRASTPYVDCPTCGLSVRSPYRWGRPS
jgi:hypothetical protein